MRPELRNRINRLSEDALRDPTSAEHLREVSVDCEAWTVVYQCDKTGRKWILDYPRSEYHGGGTPRLRQLDPHGMPIDEAIADPNT